MEESLQIKGEIDDWYLHGPNIFHKVCVILYGNKFKNPLYIKSNNSYINSKNGTAHLNIETKNPKDLKRVEKLEEILIKWLNNLEIKIVA